MLQRSLLQFYSSTHRFQNQVGAIFMCGIVQFSWADSLELQSDCYSPQIAFCHPSLRDGQGWSPAKQIIHSPTSKIQEGRQFPLAFILPHTFPPKYKSNSQLFEDSALALSFIIKLILHVKHLLNTFLMPELSAQPMYIYLILFASIIFFFGGGRGVGLTSEQCQSEAVSNSCLLPLHKQGH